MGATMKDIARVTGLGLATISSYLNGGNVTVYDMASGEQETKTLQEFREEY